MKREVLLDGVAYTLTFEELVKVSRGIFTAIDLNNHCNSLNVMEEARELLISQFSNSKYCWDRCHLSVFYVDETGKLSDSIPF